MLTVSPKNLNDAYLLKDYCDAFLVGYELYSAKHRNNFSKKDILELLNLNKTVIVRLDLMLFEDDIKKIESILKDLKEYNLLFYAIDLGIIQIAKELNIINRFIYNPETMITNINDAYFYHNIGLNAFGLSLEIPLKDALTCNNLNVFYQVFGLREMFSSKRKVFSLYLNKANLNDVKYHKYNLIEESRNDIYTAYENENGSYIYRSYYINLIKHLKEMNFKYLFIDSLNIDANIYLIIVKTYFDYLNNNIELIRAKTILNNLSLNYEDGFTYKDSVYQKEELKNE